MSGKFTIFVVCAILVQSSVAVLSPTTSENQARAQLDSSTLHAYWAVALFQIEKAIHSTTTAECQSYSESYTTKTCKAEVLPPWIAASHAVLEAILIVDPEASSAVKTARNLSDATEIKLVEGICSAIALALGKNSSGLLTKIQVVADKQASEAAISNAAIFMAIRNERNAPSKMESAIKNIESKATSERVAAIQQLFTGIQSLVSQADSENITFALQLAQNEAFAGFRADVNSKFELLQTLFTASCIVEFGVVVDSLTIEVIKASAFSDFEKVVSIHSTTGKNEKPKGDIDDENKIVVGTCDLQTAREISMFQTQKGFTTIFDTIKKEIAKVPVKNGNDSYKLQIAKKETNAADIGALNSIMEAILTIKPGASSAVRAEQNAADSTVHKGVDIVYDAVTLIGGKNSSKNLIEFEIMKNATARGASSIIANIYKAIRSDLKVHNELRDAIKHAEELSISEIKKYIHHIFDGIKIQMTAFAGSQSESKGSILAIKVARTEAIFARTTCIQIIFDVIQSLCKASAGSQDETVANSSAIRLHRETSIFQARNAIEIIFRIIIDPPRNDNAPQDDSSDIESGRAETFAAYLVALEAIFCTIPTTHPGATLALKNAATLHLHVKVDGYYAGINSTRGNDYYKILMEMQAIENRTSHAISEITSDIYNNIQKGQKCDPKTAAIIQRAYEETQSNSAKICRLVFDSNRILLSILFGRTQVTSENTLSSITAAYDEATCEFKDYITNVFDAIELVSSTCVEHQAQSPDDSCVASHL